MTDDQATTVPADSEQPQNEPTQEVDSAYGTDSAYDEDEIQSYATSLSSSVTQYKWEHGRRYHSYREGSYNFPNDDPEQERLDLNHHLCLMLLDDQLHLAPLKTNEALRILDVGTGTGIWAMEMADKYENAQVIGNDLSPIQPQWVPPNLQFEVDDIESPWPPRPNFDYIHMRYLLGAIRDWPALIRQAFSQLKPGGWIEFQDFNTHGYSEDGSADENNAFIKFCTVFNQACDKLGVCGSPGQHLKAWTEQAGFENVQHKVYKCPVGPWPRDPKYKQVGAVYYINVIDLLESALLGLLTRVEGWTPEEVQIFIAQIRSTIRKKSVHLMQELHVVWAQKPITA